MLDADSRAGVLLLGICWKWCTDLEVSCVSTWGLKEQQMGFDPNEPEQRRRLRAAMKAADITAGELWLKYFSVSGDAGEYEVEAYLQGLLSLPPIQRDLLALAANELIDELPRLHAPYSEDLTTKPGRPDARETENANEQSNPDRTPGTGE